MGRWFGRNTCARVPMVNSNQDAGSVKDNFMGLTKTANDFADYLRHKANLDKDANAASILRKVADAFEEFERSDFIGTVKLDTDDNASGN